jgi:hypothetical protein
MDNFYTYAYLRDDKTPYYVGKGKGKRSIGCHGKIGVPKDSTRILILKQNLTEEEAFKHEIYMISVLGRKDLGTGILRNMTNGGDGCSGRVCSIETKQKSSKSNKGKKRPPSTGEKISAAKKGKPGRKLTDHEKLILSLRMSGEGNVTKRPEVAEKISKAKKGKPGRVWTQEQKDSLSQKNKGKKKTEEHKQKLSEATKRYYENLRNK